MGSFINDRWILTSANCFLDSEVYIDNLQSPQSIAVSAASPNLIKQFDLGRYQIKELHFQPSSNDEIARFALLKLIRPIKSYGEQVKAICLSSNQIAKNNSQVYVAGWQSWQNKNSDQLKINFNLKQSQYKLLVSENKINSRTVVIDDAKSESHVLDTGAPVLIKNKGKFT